MKALLCSISSFVFLTISASLPAFGQSFSEDPQGAIDQSLNLAQEAISNPLIFEGLNSIVFRYNRVRVDLTPEGYESEEWLIGNISPILREVSNKITNEMVAEPLPEEEIEKMVVAFSENSAEFYSVYEVFQSEYGFQSVSANEMLTYLSAYAILSNMANSELWASLSSITGVWPLCFWQG